MYYSNICFFTALQRPYAPFLFCDTRHGRTQIFPTRNGVVGIECFFKEKAMSRSTDLDKVVSHETGVDKMVGVWILVICIFVAIVCTQIKKTPSSSDKASPAQTAKP